MSVPTSSRKEQCSFCKETFPYRDLTSHIKAKHPDYYKEKCGICGQGGFTSAAALKRHRKRNHVAASLSCPVCKKGFTPAGLSRHLAKKHPLYQNGTNFAPKVYSNSGEILNPDTTGKQLFECSLCEFKFPRLSALRYHEKRIHKIGDQIYPLSYWERTHDEKGDSESEDDSEYEDNEEEGTGDIEEPDRLYRVLKEPVHGYSEKFKLSSVSREYKLTKYALKFCRRGRALEVLRATYYDIYKKSIPPGANGFVALTLCSEETLAFPIVTPIYHLQDFSIEIFLNQVANVLTSRTSLLMDHPATLTVKYLPDEYGGMSRILKADCASVQELIVRKRGIWDPRSLDPVCLGLCVSVGLKFLFKGDTTLRNMRQRKFFKEGFFHEPTRQEAIALYETVGVPYDRPAATGDLQEFQRHLYDVYSTQMIVLDLLEPKTVIFKGKSPRTSRLFLALHDNHFYLVYEPDYFLFPYYRFCRGCGRVAPKTGYHRCDQKCSLCLSKDCDRERHIVTDESKVYCNTCNTVFPNIFCHQRHLEEPACQTLVTCRKCGQRVERQGAWGSANRDHLCNEYACRHCKKRVPVSPEHQCYIQKVDEEKALGPKDYRVVCYDVETYTTEEGRLLPYLVIAIRFCPR